MELTDHRPARDFEVFVDVNFVKCSRWSQFG